MTKEEIREKFFNGVTAEVELPSEQWLFLMAVLDKMCDDSLEKMDDMRERGLVYSQLDPRQMRMMSVPFLTRAFMADSLKEKNLLSDEEVQGKDTEWVESVFTNFNQGLPN